MKNKRNGQVLGEKQLECPSRSPDMVIFEITLQVLFYEGIEQERETIDQLEFTGEEIAKMLHQCKVDGFLPKECKVCWNTKITRQHFKGFNHS